MPSSATDKKALREANLAALKTYMRAKGYDGTGRLVVWSLGRKLVREYRLLIGPKMLTMETLISNWPSNPNYNPDKEIPYYWHPCKEALLHELTFKNGVLQWPKGSTLWKPEIPDKEFKLTKFKNRCKKAAKEWVRLSVRGRQALCESARRSLGA